MLFQTALCLLAAVATIRCTEIVKSPWYDPDKSAKHLARDDADLVELFTKFEDLEAGSRPDLVLVKAEELRGSTQTTKTSSELLEAMINLSESNKTCSKNETEFFLRAQITLTANKKLRAAKPLMAYLDHFGPRKFHQCALEAIKKLDADGEQIQGELVFFQRAVASTDYPNCVDVNTKLKEFNPSEDDWNIRGLAESLGHPRDRLFLAIVGVAAAHCDRIASRYNEQLILINIATNLNSDTNYFDGCSLPHRASEVYRICCEMQIFENRFRHNVERQIEAFVNQKRFQWLQPRRSTSEPPQA